MGLYEVSPWEAAELITQLPASSRLVRAESPETEWPDERVYLSLIEFWLHVLVWRDAKRSTRGPKPEPLVPKAAKPTRQIKGALLPIEEIDALFPVAKKR